MLKPFPFPHKMLVSTVRWSFKLITVAAFAAFTMQDTVTKPDESRFTPVVLADNLDEPMAFEVLPDGSSYIIERKGALKKYDPSAKTTSLITTIPVNTKYTSK